MAWEDVIVSQSRVSVPKLVVSEQGVRFSSAVRDQIFALPGVGVPAPGETVNVALVYDRASHQLGIRSGGRYRIGNKSRSIGGASTARVLIVAGLPVGAYSVVPRDDAQCVVFAPDAVASSLVEGPVKAKRVRGA